MKEVLLWGVPLALLGFIFFKVSDRFVRKTIKVMDSAERDKPEPNRDPWFSLVLPVVLILFIFLLLMMVE
ncbi:hypothetical protein [Limisalsivibrio acetivorans]|uniref:hypothetical protein n=1 Tax=Limisalsivibrio acetivorans TaxID=1304888 RepID=UPI0003B69FC4|nr:hypothetical protein [Limisalsivibrio acetivorans]